ncbi:hypothetical protein [Meiothermus granaticius]|uniref:Uncharacterized protein n=1 Tax=Meiothermus granaticius NBRC 107808 TaxID=1227551 RepID=A0A399FFN1_9DEIN|nr:hypothetical protein [Meiothermus granaticius]RIH94021.1 hypothetical protein Mgrana_00107 [Meiothermus granaticius NBRC 107808]GEM88150.1 hypothetical protein MGR01S_27750 [Meiothermus granaticius NBRC 107808]
MQLPLFAFTQGELLPVGAVFVSLAHRHFDLILPVWTVVEVRAQATQSGADVGYLAQALPLGCYGELLSYHPHRKVTDTGLRFPLPPAEEIDTWFRAVGRVSWHIDAWSLTRDGSIATVYGGEDGGEVVRVREDGILYVRYAPLPQEADLVAGLEALGIPWRPGEVNVANYSALLEWSYSTTVGFSFPSLAINENGIRRQTWQTNWQKKLNWAGPSSS